MTVTEKEETWPRSANEKIANLSRHLKTVRKQLEHKSDVCEQLSQQLFQLDSRFRKKNEALQEAQVLYDEVRKQLQDVTIENAELRTELQEERARYECAEEQRAKHEALLAHSRKSHVTACSLAHSDFLRQQHVTEEQAIIIGRQEAELVDTRAALARSQMLEEQNRQRVAELRGQLRLWKEFGAEGFMHGADTGVEDAPEGTEDTCGCTDAPDLLQNWFEEDDNVQDSDSMQQQLPENVAVEITDALAVLISVPIDFGDGSSGDLVVAPWHTRQDFQDIVEAFLLKYNRSSVIASALVHFLMQAEKEAESFPVMLPPQQLMDVMTQFGS